MVTVGIGSYGIDVHLGQAHRVAVTWHEFGSTQNWHDPASIVPGPARPIRRVGLGHRNRPTGFSMTRFV
jgi:hypothetical protein